MLFVLRYINNLLKFSKHLVLLSHEYLNSTKSTIILNIISKRKCRSYLYTDIANWNFPNYIGLLHIHPLYMNTCSNQLTKEILIYGHWGFLSTPFHPNSPTSFFLLLQKGKEEGITNGRKQKHWEEVEENKGLKAMEISKVEASKFFQK